MTGNTLIALGSLLVAILLIWQGSKLVAAELQTEQ